MHLLSVVQLVRSLKITRVAEVLRALFGDFSKRGSHSTVTVGKFLGFIKNLIRYSDSALDLE